MILVAAFLLFLFQTCYSGLSSCELDVSFTVASFNMRGLTNAKWNDEDSQPIITAIILRYDVILLEEVNDNDGTLIDSVLAKVNDNASSKYRTVVSPSLGPLALKEKFVFLYREEIVSVSDSSLYTGPGVDTFLVTPFIVRFKSLEAVDVPAAMTFIAIRSNPENTEAELKNLVDVYTEAKSLYDSQVVFMGDMKADCDYLTPDKLPAIPIFNDDSFTFLIDEGQDTTITDDDCAFDRIIATDSILDLLLDNSAEVFKFDEVYQMGQSLALDISDHYPVQLTLCLPSNAGGGNAYNYHVGQWGLCTATCGGGIRLRSVYCSDSQGRYVKDEMCADSGAKPQSEEACGTDPCVDYSWFSGDWDVCSKECDTGTQTRPVFCQNNDGEASNATNCDTNKPTAERECNTQSCDPYTWEIGEFGACSHTCGSGTQSRSVECRETLKDIVSDYFCPSPKPVVTRKCNTEPCPAAAGSRVPTMADITPLAGDDYGNTLFVVSVTAFVILSTSAAAVVFNMKRPQPYDTHQLIAEEDGDGDYAPPTALAEMPTLPECEGDEIPYPSRNPPQPPGSGPLSNASGYDDFLQQAAPIATKPSRPDVAQLRPGGQRESVMMRFDSEISSAVNSRRLSV